MALAALTAALVWGALFVWLVATQEDSGAAKPVAGSTTPAAPDGTPSSWGEKNGGAPGTGPDVVALAYDYDIDDERFVVALSDNVFAGRVERVSGKEPAPTTILGEDRPQTQYAVRVLAVVKSSGADPLREGDRAYVNREGGVGPEAQRRQVIEAHYCGERAIDRPLAAGEEYLFSTYYEPRRKLHTLVARPTGARLIGSREGRGAIVAAYRMALDRQENPMTLAERHGEEAACG
jgi:hypothetical protein